MSGYINPEQIVFYKSGCHLSLMIEGVKGRIRFMSSRDLENHLGENGDRSDITAGCVTILKDQQ